MRRVSIEDQGRCGKVIYEEGGNRLAGYWEFSGGEAVAYVRCGTVEEWSHQPWALDRREEILRYIADEVVRQKAPGCRAEIDARSGDILLYASAASPDSAAQRRPSATGLGSQAHAGVSRGVTPEMRAAEARWVFRLTTLRAQLGLIVLAIALLIGAGVWVRDKFLSIDPGKGTAIGLSVRTDRHVATLIQSLEPYVPTLDRNHGNDTYGISLFLVPLDGSATKLIPLRRGLSPNAFSLAKIYGSNGRTLWFDVAGLGGVDLQSYELRTEAEVAAVDPRNLPRPWGDSPLPPRLERSLAPIPAVNPAGSISVEASAPGLQGTAIVMRMDTAGEVLWRVDTGISRLGLQQVLPGEESIALVGPRPPVPGKVSEPLLVIVDHASGRQVTHSLWQ